MTFPAVKFKVEGDHLTVTLPNGMAGVIMDRCKDGFVKVSLDRPGRPRTTGENSQNHFINGACQKIAVETGNDFDTVKMAMKKMALSRGYPFDTIGTEIIPKSESKLTTAEAKILIETIQEFAAEWDISLGGEQ